MLTTSEFLIDSFTSSLTDAQVLAAITLDQNLGSVVVESQDYSLVGSYASLNIKANGGDITSENFIIEVSFEFGPPQFDMATFIVDTLTCSSLDATWSLPLPLILYKEI